MIVVGNYLLQTPGQMHAPGVDSDQDQFLSIQRTFHDSPSKFFQSFMNLSGLHYHFTTTFPHVFFLSLEPLTIWQNERGAFIQAPPYRQPVLDVNVWR
jgi:hypothetical protein